MDKAKAFLIYTLGAFITSTIVLLGAAYLLGDRWLTTYLRVTRLNACTENYLAFLLCWSNGVNY